MCGGTPKEAFPALFVTPSQIPPFALQAYYTYRRQHLYNIFDLFNATILYTLHGPTTGFARKYVGYQISFQVYSWLLVNA